MGKVTEWKSWEEYRRSEHWAVALPKGGNIPWAMFYPADYAIGSANLGYQYVFRKLREAGVQAERFFLSPVPYRSVDADTLLERFPIISASIAYEPDAEVFFKWLHNANIPLDPYERKEGNYPLVIVGGAVTYINPLLISAVADVVILGDGLDVILTLLDVLTEYNNDRDREKIWYRLSEHESIFVPPVEIIDERITVNKKICRNQPMTSEYPVHSSWITNKGAFGNTMLLELQRGCIRNCSYCTLPACFGKVRFRDFSLIESTLTGLLDEIDFDQIGLITPEAGDYPDIDKVLDIIENCGKSVSFASLRLDRLTDKMLSVLSRGGRHSITVAPETGNNELRVSCGKKFTNTLIIDKLKAAAKHGIKNVKMYFMLGLPNETDEDVKSIADLCAEIIDVTGLKLVISAGSFIPKPWTKWQMEPFIGTSEIKRRYKLLSTEVRKMKRKTPKLRLTSAKEAETEFLLAWAGIHESRKLSEDVRKYGHMKFTNTNRERTIEELKHFT